MWKAEAIIQSCVWFWECLLHISSFLKYIAWLFLTSVLPLPDDLRHVFSFLLFFILFYRQLSVVKTTLSLQLYFDSNTGLVLRRNISSFWEELHDMIHGKRGKGTMGCKMPYSTIQKKNKERLQWFLNYTTLHMLLKIFQS